MRHFSVVRLSSFLAPFCKQRLKIAKGEILAAYYRSFFFHKLACKDCFVLGSFFFPMLILISAHIDVFLSPIIFFINVPSDL